MNSNFFLISSFDPIPQHYLHGTCFQAEDLILGNEGYEKYRAVRRSEIQTGQDGSYIVVNASGGEAVIGTDFSGYYKLFLYQHAGVWILSNSLIEMVRLAAGKGLPVTIDRSHLASFFIKGAFGNQLTSLRTSIREIRLVPATMEAVITQSPSESKVTLRPTSVITASRQQAENYSDALRDYLRTWVGRMATILQSDLNVSSELTGGQDSRAVLSMMLAAAQLVGKDSIQRINFTSNTAHKTDYAVASQIADRFHLRFMNGRDDPRARSRLGLIEAYDKWKSLCLGVYAPIYFPQSRPVSTAVVFGGSGGEGHRRFYPDIVFDKFLEIRRKNIPSSADFKKLKHDILEDIEFLRQGSEASVDPMVIHYRHFRDRCHGGRTPQYTNLLSPLSSAALRRASSRCTAEQLDRRQVLADILINANNELASMPYDNPRKTFDTRHFDEKIDASDAIRSASTTGQVFAAKIQPVNNGDFEKQKALQMLRDDFLVHYESMCKSDYFPARYLETARTTVEEAARNGAFSHPVDGCAVSHVILAGELSRLCGGGLESSSSLGTLAGAFFRLWR